MILLDALPDGHFESRKYLFRKGAETARANTIGLLREVYLASEAWVSVGKSGDTKPVGPVKDPQRTEALVVYSIDVVSKQQQMFMFSLKRDPAGAVREIAPFQEKEEMQAVSNPFLLTFIAGFTSIALSRKKEG